MSSNNSSNQSNSSNSQQNPSSSSNGTQNLTQEQIMMLLMAQAQALNRASNSEDSESTP